MIKPIQTFYHGCHFRSRLEARWAVFFDALNIQWEYEPEGFDIDGIKYLPDFKLHNMYGRCSDDSPNQDILWVEVKGCASQSAFSKEHPDQYEKLRTFAYGSSNPYKEKIINQLIVLGNIPNEDEFNEHGCCSLFDIGPNFGLVDGDDFGCHISPRYKEGQLYPEGTFELCGNDSNYWKPEQPSITSRAFDRARKARFEHGEKPLSTPLRFMEVS